VSGPDILLRIPPHNLDAEKSVLGAIFLNEESIEPARDILCEQDFYREAHRLIWRAACDLTDAKQPIDVVTMPSQLNGHLEQIGGVAYIGELASFVPTSLNIRAYAKIVREKSILRKLSTFGTDIASAAYESPDVEELIAVAEYEVAEIAGKLIQKPEPTKTTTLATVIWKIEHGQEDSVPTGFAPLDQTFGGFNVGHITMLAARTSKGKTALAIQMAINAAKTGFATAYFSLEQPADEMWARAIGCQAQVDLFSARRRGYRNGEKERVEAAQRTLESAPLEIFYRPSMRPRDLRLECKRVARKTGPLKLVIVDYFSLMRGDRHEKERWREMQEAVLALKSLAGELGVPILLLSQLNRETNEDMPPSLANLRDTGATEEHASNVLFLWQRPPKSDVSPMNYGDWEDIEVIIGKQRNGPAGLRVPMQFKKQWGSFNAR
jgi:replicative DNA helicase